MHENTRIEYSPLGSRFRLPTPAVDRRRALGQSRVGRERYGETRSGGGGVTQGLTERTAVYVTRSVGGTGGLVGWWTGGLVSATAARSRNWADTGGQPSVRAYHRHTPAHAHTRAHRDTHTVFVADSVYAAGLELAHAHH